MAEGGTGVRRLSSDERGPSRTRQQTIRLNKLAQRGEETIADCGDARTLRRLLLGWAA
ncbi:MAG TPA: hypothetical protein VHY56_00575 [Candidatus Binataceae bacterium]|nr:hypothetical protein [Candidatus Binataceae bacterium]